MWIILVSLIVGIMIGIKKIIPDKYMKFNSRFQQSGVILLIFSMGASVGANRELINNLRAIGVKALTFALLTTFFSVLVVYLVSSRFLKEDR